MSSPTLLLIDQVAVAEIEVIERLRPVSEAAVESLIASIKETGVMKDAIDVRKKKGSQLVLIAGAHRLEAAKRLGWKMIQAKVWTDVTDDWARLIEVDDNIAGAELSPLDTAVFLATRKRIYEKLHPEMAAGVFKGNQHTGKLVGDIVSFTTATAEKFSMSRRNVERLVKAGYHLAPDEARRLRTAPRPVTLKDLGEIAKVGNPAERYHVVAELESGNAKSAADARRSWKAREQGAELPAKDPVDEHFNKLATDWGRAKKAAKRRFVDEFAEELEALLSDIRRGGA